MRPISFLLIFALMSCVPRHVSVSLTDGGGYTVEGNVPTARIVDVVYAQTARTTLDGALEHGVPAHVQDPVSGTQLSVGGDQPFMYGWGANPYSSFGRNDRDLYAIATSEAALNVALSRGERPREIPAIERSEYNALEGDVRALQTLIGSLHEE